MISIFIVVLCFFLLLTPVYATTSLPVDISEMNIYEIQEAVDKGYIDYEQLINVYLSKIEKYNKDYNAVITINKNALNEAKALNEEYKKSGRRSLIHGLPILIKDNIDVVGMPTTAGTKLLLDSYPKKNASVVQKLIDNGAIIIGKANMSTFALDGTSSYSSFGHTKNAYNLLYSSYGSTGGGAVGVAAGFAVAALGTDTGVSIRLPAAANNLVGFRPTYGKINMDGIIHLDSSRDVVGPITRYVEDSAIIMDIIDNSYAEYSNAIENNDLKGVRIGVLKSSLYRTDAGIVELFKKTISDLQSLGAEIVYIDVLGLTYDFSYIEMCYDFNQYIQGTTSNIKSLSSLVYNINVDLSQYINQYCSTGYKNTYEYNRYLNVEKENIKKANSIFESNKLDVIIYPTIESKLLQLSQIGSYYVKTDSSKTANLVGFPSLNVQIGFSENLPYGMEIMSQVGKEKTIYNIAYNLQQKRNYYVLPSISPNTYTVSLEMKRAIEFSQFISNVINGLTNPIDKIINLFNSLK